MVALAAFRVSFAGHGGASPPAAAMFAPPPPSYTAGVCPAPGLPEEERFATYGPDLRCAPPADGGAAISEHFAAWRERWDTSLPGGASREYHVVAERCLAKCECGEVKFLSGGKAELGGTGGALPAGEVKVDHCYTPLNCHATGCLYGTFVSQGYVNASEKGRAFLLMLGDSVTMTQRDPAGQGRESARWAALVPEADMLNYGVGTETSEQLLSRLWMARAQRDITHVSLLIGTNDVMRWAEANAGAEAAVEHHLEEIALRVVANIDLVLRLLRSFWPRVAVVLATLPPAAPRRGGAPGEDFARTAADCEDFRNASAAGRLMARAVERTNVALRRFASMEYRCRRRCDNAALPAVGGGIDAAVKIKDRVPLLEGWHGVSLLDLGATLVARGEAAEEALEAFGARPPSRRHVRRDCVHWQASMYRGVWVPALRRALRAWRGRPGGGRQRQELDTATASALVAQLGMGSA